MLQKLYRIPLFRRLFSHIPPGELLGFLIVGIWNTAFGYATFVGFTILISRRFPRYGYIPAGLLSSILSISVAFLGYKWFIFKTRGNYLREWIRCMAVYGSSMLLGLVLLPSAVFLVRHLTPIQGKAPYVAAALLTCLTSSITFLAIRNSPSVEAFPPSP